MARERDNDAGKHDGRKHDGESSPTKLVLKIELWETLFETSVDDEAYHYGLIATFLSQVDRLVKVRGLALLPNYGTAVSI